MELGSGGKCIFAQMHVILLVNLSPLLFARYEEERVHVSWCVVSLHFDSGHFCVHGLQATGGRTLELCLEHCYAPAN